MKEDNYFKYTVFNFICGNEKCKEKSFSLNLSENGEPPEFWPEDNEYLCPTCGSEKTKVVGGKLGGYAKARGGSRVSDHSEADKGYAEDWYKEEIKNTKEALKFEKGISPYSKYKIDYKELERQGKLYKSQNLEKEVKERKRRSEEHSRMVADKIDKSHIDNVGKRSDG